MISGIVRAGLEATIPLDVIDASGQPHRINAIIDTGFTGFLTLPLSMIAALGLPFLGRQQSNGRLAATPSTMKMALRALFSYQVILGNGSVDLLDVYRGTVPWDGQDRAAEVDCADSDPLVGMSLLDGYDLHIEARIGGIVTITALP